MKFYIKLSWLDMEPLRAWFLC